MTSEDWLGSNNQHKHNLKHKMRSTCNSIKTIFLGLFVFWCHRFKNCNTSLCLYFYNLPANNHDLQLRSLLPYVQPDIHSKDSTTAVKYGSKRGHQGSQHYSKHQASCSLKKRFHMKYIYKQKISGILITKICIS